MSTLTPIADRHQSILAERNGSQLMSAIAVADIRRLETEHAEAVKLLRQLINTDNDCDDETEAMFAAEEFLARVDDKTGA